MPFAKLSLFVHRLTSPFKFLSSLFLSSVCQSVSLSLRKKVQKVSIGVPYPFLTSKVLTLLAIGTVSYTFPIIQNAHFFAIYADSRQTDTLKNIFHNNKLLVLFTLSKVQKIPWKVSSYLRDATDIYRFPIVHMVKTHFLLENLSISEPSLGILQNFQHTLVLPNIKYNCAVLFLRQVNYLFNYAPKTKTQLKKKFS